jgi:hypothetical protein
VPALEVRELAGSCWTAAGIVPPIVVGSVFAIEPGLIVLTIFSSRSGDQSGESFYEWNAVADGGGVGLDALFIQEQLWASFRHIQKLRLDDRRQPFDVTMDLAVPACVPILFWD